MPTSQKDQRLPQKISELKNIRKSSVCFPWLSLLYSDALIPGYISWSHLFKNDYQYLQKKSAAFLTAPTMYECTVKGRVTTACLIYLVTNKNVDTSRALSVNLVNLLERNIEHRGKFSSNFWGNHFFQVDCMINAGCPTAILASTACSLWLPLQHSAIRLLLADIDG